MTFRGFLRWVWFLEWQESEAPATRVEYYLAQIAAYIEASGTGKSVHINGKLMKFKMEDATPIDPQVRIQNSKNYWFTLGKLGVRPPTEAVRRKTAEWQKQKRKAPKRGQRAR